jgi:16S rRNA (cytidine1402-2'-O)-methyltransferase
MRIPDADRRTNETRPTGRLILVATPIGNLEDLSPRAKKTLAECDLVAAEDTRYTGTLLSRLGIGKSMISCFDANEAIRASKIVDACIAGKTVCLVTSAGHPCISDPGHQVVAEAVRAGIPVSVVPGPCAAVSALSVSGLPSDSFAFHGFLPRKGKSRKNKLEEFARGGTHVLYESPVRLLATLQEFQDVFSDPEISVCRELTKIHEETLHGRCSEVISAFSGREALGEITITLHIPVMEKDELPLADLRKIIDLKNQLGLSVKDASLAGSILLGMPKSVFYKALLREENAKT